MIIKNFRALNYKGFSKSARIDLADGLNLIIGANNAGKSALLEAVSQFPFGSRPHREKDRPQNYPLNPTSSCELSLSFAGADVKPFLLSAGQIIVARQESETEETLNKRINQTLCTSLEVLLRNNAGVGNVWEYADHRSSLFQLDKPTDQVATIVGDLATQQFRINSIHTGAENSASMLGKMVSESVFRFNAERINLAQFPVGVDPILHSSCQNLPAVLQILQHDHFAFEELNARLKFIFPNVFRVSTIPIGGNQVEIRVWFVDPEPRRPDFAIPLSECGTGVSQVLAMLYVIISSAASRVIVIDEPNSFLNPGAARRLVHTLREYPQHQYILATHSPEVIASAGLNTIHLVCWEGGQSLVLSMNATEASALQTILTELGVKISDVFGSDAILWVEGPTERDCVSEILRAEGIPIGLGLSVVPLSSVGDFEGASSRVIWDLHQTITRQNALVPRTVGYVLDREGRSENEIQRMEKESRGLIQFLDRRMYENYLIDEDALSAFLDHIDPNLRPRTQGCIVAAILAASENPKIWRGSSLPTNIEDAGWLANVHGANLLLSIVSELTEARQIYRKVEHGVWLTRWLLRNKPEKLRELTHLYASVARSDA